MIVDIALSVGAVAQGTVFLVIAGRRLALFRGQCPDRRQAAFVGAERGVGRCAAEQYQEER